MYVEQIFTGCLAEMAYFVESNGEAAIIDPLRETQPYLDLAAKHSAKIKYIFLTHFHADFVSGQVDLAKATGASIVFGPNANPNYEFHSGIDGEIFKLGKAQIKLIHTPGHTMESSSYLLIDEQGNTPYICTGDCLFIGDVGRPDLAVKSNLNEEDLAGHLYDSLRNKIMTLPDDIIVYPNHGAGSACGKNMSSETFDTLLNQKNTNYALRADMSKKEFIKEVTTGLKPPPQYFPSNVMKNKGINTSINEILGKGTQVIDIEEFKKLIESDEILILDTRKGEEYIKKGTIPNALWVGLDGSFAPWIGALVKDINQKILFICDEGKEREVVTRLSRVGYDNTIGFLKGGFQSWINDGNVVDEISSVTSENFVNSKIEQNILDVRKENEYISQHINFAKNAPLDTLFQDLNNLDKSKSYHIHCAGGYRSLIAASILKAHGFNDITNIEGGFDTLKTTNINITEFICPTTIV